jgi:hypothetical protein
MVPENKQKEDTNKLTLLAFKIIAILHNTLLVTFIKLLETVSKGLFRNRSPNRCHTPAGVRSGKYGGLLSASLPEEHHERRMFCRRGGNPRTCLNPRTWVPEASSRWNIVDGSVVSDLRSPCITTQYSSDCSSIEHLSEDTRNAR